tara:strand:+ start:177 stop:437 length:261 start_codon:yes stop_codon:yes gene_type:complete
LLADGNGNKKNVGVGNKNVRSKERIEMNTTEQELEVSSIMVKYLAEKRELEKNLRADLKEYNCKTVEYSENLFAVDCTTDDIIWNQ